MIYYRFITSYFIAIGSLVAFIIEIVYRFTTKKSLSEDLSHRMRRITIERLVPDFESKGFQIKKAIILDILLKTLLLMPISLIGIFGIFAYFYPIYQMMLMMIALYLLFDVVVATATTLISVKKPDLINSVVYKQPDYWWRNYFYIKMFIIGVLYVLLVNLLY